MKNRKFVPLIVYLVILAVALSWAGDLFGKNANQIPYSRVVELFRSEQVRAFEVEGQVITMELHTPYNGETTVSAYLASPESFQQEMGNLLAEQTAAGVLDYYHYIPEDGFSPYDLVIPLLLVGMVLLFLWAMFMSRANSANPLQNFGKARTVLGIPD